MEEGNAVLSRHAKPRNRKTGLLLLSGLSITAATAVAIPLALGPAVAEPQVKAETKAVGGATAVQSVRYVAEPAPQPVPKAADPEPSTPAPATPAPKKPEADKPEVKKPSKAEIAVAYARKQLGKPYIWGGEGPRGFDCSGLMLMAYKAAGIDLPRVSTAQYHGVKTKVAFEDLKPGDLIFSYGSRSHVGIVSRPGYMIHASRTGMPIKEEKLSSWRKAVFSGAVRPAP
ncbi:C40 family peptidase [Rhizohabitans arisaemae]|uniref:C40 family peptidase n=1 Tax=Rhizohabitans arisaemae TaxID=2720610 RepID=UPI0024B050EF|nr:NlpC/P60 family protein [Rhizohabitans arisaemae]